MLISNVSQSQTMQGELRKVDGTRRAKGEEPAAKKGGADRSDLSTDVGKRRDVQDEARMVSSMVKGQPDVRTDRVAEAKARVSNGYYNTEAFAETLAAKMIDTVI
jgi:anti-sigma28 factor (negative regulator of flagellin synthesis)